MPEVEVYGPTVSPFVVKVIAAADYKRLEYTHREYVSIRELSKLNPATGKVPFARIDGELVFDSTLILRRFEKVRPAPQLFSADAATSVKQRMLEDWSDESLYWYLQAIRWNVKNEQRTIAQNARFVPAPLRPFAKPLLRTLVGRQPAAQGMGRLPYDLLIAEFGKRLDDLVLLLGERAFFYSDRPGAADFAIYGVFQTGCSENVTPDFAEQVAGRPTLVAWRERVGEAARHLAGPQRGR